MQYDVIVIGGSCARMAAALQLIWVRKAVLVIDAGQRRNRFAIHSHGFPAQDGRDPGEIARSAYTAGSILIPRLGRHDGRRSHRRAGQRHREDGKWKYLPGASRTSGSRVMRLSPKCQRRRQR